MIEEKMNDKDIWKLITKIYNDRKFSGESIVRKLRNIFEIEFFEDIIELNKTELDNRKREIKKLMEDIDNEK